MNRYIKLFCAGIILLAASCNKGPKVIPVNEEESAESGTGIFSTDTPAPIPDESQNSIDDDVHRVVALEVLPTTKYVYVRVKEGSEEFWIATIKMEVTVGKTYFYRDGLLKTNFESKEHNRIFDRMYLVSSLVDSDHGSKSTATESEPSHAAITDKIVVEGSVKIAELVANPKKYEGKVIQISGKCVKLNANIMGRNWVHLEDGSNDDFDLVITSNVAIPEGHTVTMTGKVSLNKDFGAGYQYSIILEEGEFVQ
ncbi:MAG TPA: hypothetical protein VFW11_01755 [Cyclobacteriaceae bacterium]|nr:hypothetical protein [Cyclobacteriaceae bacterium]